MKLASVTVDGVGGAGVVNEAEQSVALLPTTVDDVVVTRVSGLGELRNTVSLTDLSREGEGTERRGEQ